MDPNGNWRWELSLWVYFDGDSQDDLCIECVSVAVAEAIASAYLRDGYSRYEIRCAGTW